MKREIVTADLAPKAIGPYSQAIKCECSGLMFCSGQIAINPQTGELVGPDISAQTQKVLENLKAVLEAAGLGLENVVKTNVFLDNMDDFNAMNEIYSKFFTDNPPARAAVEVSRLPKNVKVEIEAIACY